MEKNFGREGKQSMKEYPSVYRIKEPYVGTTYMVDEHDAIGGYTLSEEEFKWWCKLRTYWLDGELYHSGKKCCDCKKGKISRKEIV